MRSLLARKFYVQWASPLWRSTLYKLLSDKWFDKWFGIFDHFAEIRSASISECLKITGLDEHLTFVTTKLPTTLWQFR